MHTIQILKFYFIEYIHLSAKRNDLHLLVERYKYEYLPYSSCDSNFSEDMIASDVGAMEHSSWLNVGIQVDRNRWRSSNGFLFTQFRASVLFQ